MDDRNHQSFSCIHRNSDIVVVLVNDLFFERIKGGIKSRGGPEPCGDCLDDEREQGQMSTRLLLSLRPLAQTKLFQKGDVGLIHVSHMGYQGHGGNHLVCDFPPNGPQRLLLHRSPLFKVRKGAKVEKWNIGTSLGSILSLCSTHSSERFISNLRLDWNGFLSGNFNRLFCKKLYIFDCYPTTRAGGDHLP